MSKTVDKSKPCPCMTDKAATVISARCPIHKCPCPTLPLDMVVVRRDDLVGILPYAINYGLKPYGFESARIERLEAALKEKP